MLKKLRSRGPIDVPTKFRTAPGIVAIAFLLLGLVLVAGLFASIGILARDNALLLVLGIGSGIVAFGILTYAGQKIDL